MKIRRSTRLVDMTYYLLQNPRQLVSLTFFAERYQSAKSSISEDLVIIKQTFEQQGVGTLQTIPGAAGGVKYIPYISEEEADLIIGELCNLFENPGRILPGGYLYMTDLLSNPRYINGAGRLFASVFARQPIDAVMTVATKGIPLAYAVANYLDVPVVIAFKANVVGIGVLVESTDIEERLINNFVSLIRLSEVDVKEKAIQVEKGNYSLAPFDEGLVEAE